MVLLDDALWGARSRVGPAEAVRCFGAIALTPRRELWLDAVMLHPDALPDTWSRSRGAVQHVADGLRKGGVKIPAE